MTIVFKTDSDNYVHQVWAQEQAASCAVASIWMARNQAKQMTVNETEWPLAWHIFRRVVMQIPLALDTARMPAGRTFDPSQYQNNQATMGNMFSNFGTYMPQVAQALANEGLKTFISPLSVVQPSILSDTKPAIILLGWYNGTKRVGGHFIVASRVTKAGKIVYLDPWGGQLSEMGIGPNYQGTGRFEKIVYVSAH